jgi:hypothetical protein
LVLAFKQYEGYVSEIRKGLVKYGVDMASCGMIYIPSFMKIDAAIQARFCLGNLIGCNVGLLMWEIYVLRL